MAKVTLSIRKRHDFPIVSIPCGSNCNIIHRVESPGLWGMDTKTGEYASMIYAEEVGTLKIMLEYLGFTIID